MVKALVALPEALGSVPTPTILTPAPGGLTIGSAGTALTSTYPQADTHLPRSKISKKYTYKKDQESFLRPQAGSWGAGQSGCVTWYQETHRLSGHVKSQLLTGDGRAMAKLCYKVLNHMGQGMSLESFPECAGHSGQRPRASQAPLQPSSHITAAGSGELDLDCDKATHNELDSQPDFCFQ